jgi:hypothetical protein
MPTTQHTWETIRTWLEQPLLASQPDLTRLQVYKILLLQRAAGCNDTVFKYLTRKLHRGQPASPPAEGQLVKFLPLMIALDYPNLKIVPTEVAS